MGDSSADFTTRVESWLAGVGSDSLLRSTPRKRQKTSHPFNRRRPRLPTPSDSSSSGSSQMTSTPRSSEQGPAAIPRERHAATQPLISGDGVLGLEETEEETSRANHSTADLFNPFMLEAAESGIPPLQIANKKRKATETGKPRSTRTSSPSASNESLSRFEFIRATGLGTDSIPSGSNSPTKSVSAIGLRPLDDYAINTLDQLTPSVNLVSMNTWVSYLPQPTQSLGEIQPSSPSRRQLPQSVQRLYSLVGRAIREDAVIPRGLQTQLEGRLRDAYQADFLPADRFYTSSAAVTQLDSTVADAKLWDLIRAVHDTISASQGGVDEASITADVIIPLLSFASSVDYTASKVRVLNLQTVPIGDSYWVPRLSYHSESHRRGQRVDIALSLDQQQELKQPAIPSSDVSLKSSAHRPHVTRKMVLGRQCHALHCTQSLNQTATHPYAAMFAYFEIKTAQGRDPRSQLCTWAASGHLKAEKHGWDTTIPRIGITIVGATWEFYAIFWDTEMGQLAVLGPQLMGTATDELALFKLVNVLRVIMKWGSTEFKKLFAKGVLDKLVPEEPTEN